MKKFDNYKSNLSVLSMAGSQDLSNDFIISGIIDMFNIQFELGWKVLKELLFYEGVSAASTGSPRQIIKEAYRFYSCIEEDVWLQMLADRNDNAHIYSKTAAQRLVSQIIESYIPVFQKLESSIENQYESILATLA